MRDPLFRIIKKFFAERLEGEPTLLLAFSGGCDSTALLHLLLECRRFFYFKLHLVHVDHGWRKESAQEAKELEKTALKLNLPMDLRRLEALPSKNLEEWSRNERYRVFQEIYRAVDAKALILAHHADDQAETILKRLFEGSSLLSLGGMRPESHLFGMNIWRPLLGTSKSDLLVWLQKRAIPYFNDPTNSDSRYLRSRLREDLFPFIGEVFGKEVKSNLIALSESAQEVMVYLRKKITPYLALLRQEGEEMVLPLNCLPPLEKWELKAFLDYQDIDLTRTAFENFWQALQKKDFKNNIISKRHVLVLEKDCLRIKTI